MGHSLAVCFASEGEERKRRLPLEHVLRGACSFCFLAVKNDSYPRHPASLDFAATAMNWLTRYQIRLYFRNSLWVLPALAIAFALVFVRVLDRIEDALGLRMDLSPETARTLMSTVASSTLTLLVLIGSAVLVAIQLASAQLTPRIIALVYRNVGRKLVLALFVFTFTFSVMVMVRIDRSVPLLSGYIAAASFLISLALFMVFIDNMGKTLRPSSAVRMVGLA